jgi:hypothetical protein
MHELAQAPDDVVLQQWAEPAQGDPFGRRVRADGTVEECLSATAAFEDGEWRFGTQPLEWRDVTRIGADGVARLLEQARALLALPPATGMRITKAVQTWTVVLDGERREVEADGTEDAVVALDQSLQLAVAEARQG